MAQDFKPQELRIINYPDPRLKKVAKPVTVFDERLRAIATRMLELMRESEGVGLAAPQVGLDIRLFVTNPSSKPGDDHVYVNPVLSDAEGGEDYEEGCLSLPDIKVSVTRPTQHLKITAQDLTGQRIEETATGFTTRVWQHETDHLNGKLIIDYMAPLAAMQTRKKLRELEEDYAAAHAPKKKTRLPF
jgi:peptide deformylase